MSNSDWFQWYLITIGGIEDWPQSLALKLGLFRPKFGLNFGFWLTLQDWLIQYVWCFRFWFLSMIFDHHWCYLRLTQFFGPKLWIFRPKFIPKFGFQLIYWHQNLQFLFPSMIFIFSMYNISPIPISTYYCSISVGPSQISLVFSVFRAILMTFPVFYMEKRQNFGASRQTLYIFHISVKIRPRKTGKPRDRKKAGGGKK